MTDRAIPPSLRDSTDQPIFERSLRDGLRRLPALDLPHNPLSTARRQPGILMHVHPVLRWNLKLQQPQLPRSEPRGQPTESSQLAWVSASKLTTTGLVGTGPRWRTIRGARCFGIAIADLAGGSVGELRHASLRDDRAAS